MTAKFYAMLAFFVVILVGWTYTHYQYELIEEAQIKDLTSYPVYAYVNDLTDLEPLLKELKGYSATSTVKHESGAEAAAELVSSYNLPVSEDMLSGFQFPDVLTINFKPTDAALTAKPRIMDTLRRFLPEIDIDSQSTAWAKADKQLKSMRGRKISVSILISLLFLSCFIYLRMNYELRLLLLQKRKMISVVDLMHYKSQIKTHSLILFFVPLIINAGLYYGLLQLKYGYFGYPDDIIPYWVFLIQAGVMLIGTLVVMIELYLMDHDNRYHREEITVTATPHPESSPSTEDHES